MDSDRPSGNAGKPGASPSDFDERTAAQGSETVPPVQSSPTPEPAQSDQRPHLTVQAGGNSTTRAAHRIGGALATSAAADIHSRLRHGLEVVSADPPLHSSDQPADEDDIAARMMQEIEEAVVELRRHAAGRLISLQRSGETPTQRPGQTDRCGLAHELYDFVIRIQQRARRLAAEKPIETAAALVALGVAFGAALHLRKSR